MKVTELGIISEVKLPPALLIKCTRTRARTSIRIRARPYEGFSDCKAFGVKEHGRRQQICGMLLNFCAFIFSVRAFVFSVRGLSWVCKKQQMVLTISIFAKFR